ncbi:MAG TPA: histidine phosphatase family protein [Candidatus Saccharimonadales bacterium]|nr:histidine phosphatase family protein [Candidatus Saccharimonadales bacterium]
MSVELTVDLVRHAQSDLNKRAEDLDETPIIGGRQNEVELSDLGIAQARQLGQFALAHDIRPTRVFASPAERTLGTHKYSAEVMGLDLEPIIDLRLQEMDQGDWTNQPRTIYSQPSVQLAMRTLGRDFAAPGGQSMNDMADELADFLASLQPDPEVAAEHIWVHTHGIKTKSWLGRIFGWTSEQTYRTAIDNASMTRIHGYGNDWAVEFINQRTDVSSPHSSATKDRE